MTAAPLIPTSALDGTGNAALVIGLSGGMDSMVLLHALAMFPQARARDLRALHVHHGLHASADDWLLHCETVCATLGVPLRSVRVEVHRDSGDGLEAAARHARHAAFAAELGNGEVLALAHHRDDQAETFLLRALRGSGVDGLAAMRAWRRFARGWLWRPLLGHSRAQLLAYAQVHGLRWIEDPSNSDSRFDRNFLRQQVLPLLGERWPHVHAAVARSAELSAEAADLLAEEDARSLALLRTADANVISREGLQALPPARRARVLRRWIAELDLPSLPAEGIAHIETQVLTARDDADPCFRWHGAELRAWRDLVHAGPLQQSLGAGWSCEWDGATTVSLPDGSVLLLEGASGFGRSLRVHARQGGERITLPGRDHSHTLKHVLQELGVPPWVRERLPLLSDDSGELLAAGDLACSAGFGTWLREHSARLLWQCD
ncbi:tRNA lysidine(34) synthetase TilS [Lysobacter sp. Root494]|uniref:tRNA lysidine(34) synthetase TilS n=1 Tax=Lysobacter sp. Root494 TaxID=1736549 RepID=UPI000701C8E9|nr:tRNA lysidine(34) synthetase TilS [Lysobacter sp. Root494]KQY51971.1 tRNA(Ile)-lysidine synthase [Lysobacter sp. Root494]